MSSNPVVIALVTALDSLAEQDMSGLTDIELRADLLDLLGAVDRLQAQVVRRVETFDARGLAVEDGCRSTRGWLRAFGRMSDASAGDRVNAARLLRDLPALAAAMAAGDASLEHVRQVARLATRVGIDVVARAEPVLVTAAAGLDPVDLGRVCARVRAHADPDGSVPDAAVDFRRRGLSVTGFDGMVLVRGQLDPEGGGALLCALDALTPPVGDGDGRTFGQRRADALVELARGALRDGQVPSVGGARPQVGVLVTPQQLAHLDGVQSDAAHHGGARGGGVHPDGARSDAARHGGARGGGAHHGGVRSDDARHGGARGGGAHHGGVRSDDAHPGGARGGGVHLDGVGDSHGPPGQAQHADPPRQTTPDGSAPDSGAPRGTAAGPVSDGQTAAPFSNDPEPGEPVLAEQPAWLDWVGDVPTPVAQRLACDADVWRVVFDPATGRPVDVGRAYRLVPHWIRKALHARDRGCRFPGCRAPTAWSDAHHLLPWARGGPTNIDNLILLCRFHHSLVHEGRWQIRLDTGRGEVHATRPDGRPYEIRDNPVRALPGPTRTRRVA